MDYLNVLFGCVTLASAAFSYWVYNNAKKNEGIERTKHESVTGDLDDAGKLLNAIGLQANLLIQVSRRDETSKDELRHLAVSLQYTVIETIELIRKEKELFSAWVYGSPLQYLNRKPTTSEEGQAEIASNDNEATQQESVSENKSTE